MSTVTAGIATAPAEEAYRLDEQVGFALRRASQRHIAIFARHIGELTPPQFATLAMLAQTGPTSQNQLGTLVAMDAATVKGVIDRLKARGLVAVVRHEEDRRRLVVSLTDEGGELVDRLLPLARRITRETVAPLSPREVETLMRLLSKIG
jgi:MarR family transcriptional regulator, lower aerobic nicotinate degradation pathway regulator